MTATNMKSSTSGFATIMPNSIKLPSPQIMMRMPSPNAKLPSPNMLLTKSSSKLPVSTFTKSMKPTDTPNFFTFNDFFFNTNYDANKADIPSGLDSATINSNQMSQMGNPMGNALSAQMSSQAQMSNAQMAYHQQQQQQHQQQQQQQQHHHHQQQQQHNPSQMGGPLSAQMNGPLSAQMNAPIGTGAGNFYKWGNFFDIDSPYTKFNQKFLYPFMNFNAGNEEGFSPFLKNNMMLDLNTNSQLLKKDKATFFTFKNEPNLKGGDQMNSASGGVSYPQEQNAEHNSNYKQDNYLDDKMRPKKKLKV